MTKHPADMTEQELTEWSFSPEGPPGYEPIYEAWVSCPIPLDCRQCGSEAILVEEIWRIWGCDPRLRKIRCSECGFTEWALMPAEEQP